MKIETYDHLTGQITSREMTAEELAQHESDLADALARKKEESDRAELKKATLTKLGLTAEEVAALLS